MARTTPPPELPGPPPTTLRSPLPPHVRKALAKRGIDEDAVLVGTDTDLDIVGEYSELWVIVTREKVFVFLSDPEEEEAILQREVLIQEIESARMDTRVGSGFLEIKTQGVFEELARFSNKNAEKFAKVAAQIKNLAGGKEIAPADVDLFSESSQLRRFLDRPDVRVRRGTVFFRFLRFTKGYWPYTVLAMALVVLTICFLLVPQQLVKILIDQVFEAEHDKAPRWFASLTAFFRLEPGVEWLWLLVGLLAATTLLGSIIGILRESLAVHINNRLGYDLRREVFRKLQDMAVRYHELQPVGQLMTRCSQDIETLQAFINQLTSGFGFQLLLVIGVAVTMFSMNWWLALIACVPAPFVMAFTIFFTRWVTPKWRKYWSRRSDLNSSLHSFLSGIRVVNAFAQEPREEQRFGGISGGFRDAGLNVGAAQAWFYPTMGFVFQLGGYFIWIYGGTQILTGTAGDDLSVGELIAFLGYLGMFYAPLNSLTQMSTWFTQFTTQAHRVFEILDQDIEIHDAPDAVDFEIQGAIEFKNVTFGYDPHIPILKDVSFRVHPGKMIGIVGHSGCGKSTTVSLIMRFYEANEGEVLIDNTPVERIRKQCLRRQIGLVAQDPFLFRGTVAENIAYGNPDVPPERILDCALQANAHMFITRNHDGYDSRLGERGAGLSGGERQRVAIARALVHNPHILILDEATSSVDTIAEREIQKALEALSRGRTTIAIAHRLSTLRNCDHIMVFEDGEIREQGSHDQLMDQRGIYYKLVQTQIELNKATADNVDGLHDLNEEKELLEEKRPEKRAAAPPPRHQEIPRIRYVTPAELHITAISERGLQVSYRDVTYDHVRAYRCFPVSRPSEFIALWTGATALEHKEIGMIRRLKELTPGARLAVEHELLKRYFIHYIEQIYSIEENKNNMAFLVWHVKTNKGDKTFITKRWERHIVVEGGKNGRIIFDIDDNRYEIVDLNELDAASRDAFFEYIYW